MIKALITDFDGTLVDTYEANLYAYQEAFSQVGLTLSAQQYRDCFGYRFERFMQEMGVTDSKIASQIKEIKKNVYPLFFTYLRPNVALITLLRSMRAMGCKVAIASTARKENLLNAINHLGLADDFDLIYAGVDVEQGKPSPEIYIKTMAALGVSPSETLIFEDSEVGIQAAKTSGAHYMIVSPKQFEN